MMEGPATGGGMETLKRVKESEEAAERGLAALRAEVEATLAQLRADAARAIQELKARTEAARESALGSAKAQAEAEAAALLAEGRKAAHAIELKANQTVAAKREQVLSAVLGSFRPSDGN